VVEFQNAPLLDRAVLAEVESHQAAYPSVSLELRGNCPKIKVAIHEMWLRRLVRHLIRNSVRATPSKQKTLRVTVRTFVEGSMAEVQVEDTGEGVRPEIERLLFRQPIPHEDGRLGWGLLLVGFLAEQHGGYAKLVRSQPGAGACFAIGIPQAQTVTGSPR
jgi:signal transduction histidine kinase